MSLVSRATLARELALAGVSVPAERIVSAASAAAGHCPAPVRRRSRSTCMAAPDALTEFDGLRLLSHDEAAEPGARAAAVIVGDAGEEFTPRNMQSAFTLLRGGARFVAMHKNRWWLTPAGVTLDAGAYVAGLEYATERRALVTGKPSRDLLRRGRAACWPAGVGRRPAARASRPGTWRWSATISGTTSSAPRRPACAASSSGPASTATPSWRVAAETGGRAPDAVAPSIVEVVAALEPADRGRRRCGRRGHSLEACPHRPGRPPTARR